MTTDKGKAETLNRYFSSVFTLEDRSNILSVENLGDKEQKILETTEDMIVKVITKLKTDKSPCPET